MIHETHGPVVKIEGQRVTGYRFFAAGYDTYMIETVTWQDGTRETVNVKQRALYGPDGAVCGYGDYERVRFGDGPAVRV